MSLRKHYQRSRNPKGFWGYRVIKAMNGKQHAALPEWVFADLEIKKDAQVLDVGCGGGANVARMLEMCPEGIVTGMDYSTLALEEANDYNYRAIVDKKCYIVGGNAVQMPRAKELYDLVTAFETVYYWSSLELGLKEIFRVLKPGGTCVIANEMDGLDPEHKKLEKSIAMLVYSIEDISDILAKVGFIDIKQRHDEERHFICVTAKKP